MDHHGGVSRGDGVLGVATKEWVVTKMQDSFDRHNTEQQRQFDKIDTKLDRIENKIDKHSEATR